MAFLDLKTQLSQQLSSESIEDAILLEMQLLQEIFFDELEVCEDESGAVSSLSVLLKPSVGESKEECCVRMTLVIDLLAGYPETSPSIAIRSPRGLADAHIDSILDEMRRHAQQNVGTPCLYSLIDLAKESLSDNNRPSGDCAICITQFEEGDDFHKTPCYHFFHLHCLGQYCEHRQAMAKEQSDDDNTPHPPPPADDKDDADKIPCPVCRSLLLITVEELRRQVKACAHVYGQGDDEVDFCPSEELRRQQKQMEALLHKQSAKGGIIDKSVNNTVQVFNLSAAVMTPSLAPSVEVGAVSPGGCSPLSTSPGGLRNSGLSFASGGDPASTTSANNNATVDLSSTCDAGATVSSQDTSATRSGLASAAQRARPNSGRSSQGMGPSTRGSGGNRGKGGRGGGERPGHGTGRHGRQGRYDGHVSACDAPRSGAPTRRGGRGDGAGGGSGSGGGAGTRSTVKAPESGRPAAVPSNAATSRRTKTNGGDKSDGGDGGSRDDGGRRGRQKDICAAAARAATPATAAGTSSDRGTPTRNSQQKSRQPRSQGNAELTTRRPDDHKGEQQSGEGDTGRSRATGDICKSRSSPPPPPPGFSKKKVNESTGRKGKVKQHADGEVGGGSRAQPKVGQSKSHPPPGFSERRPAGTGAGSASSSGSTPTFTTSTTSATKPVGPPPGFS